MNKILKGILCAGVCGTLLFSVGCKKKDTKTLDSETRWLKLSTQAVDGNFNPFFYTAQPDGAMVSNTQIAMLTTDEKGKLVCGQNQPTVVLDYKTTMYDAAGNVSSSGDTHGRTEYEFVIKNGIKFSDGVDLTIKDVLFNLYVYLDPSYTGSSTIYSTDIKGLKAYRAQKKGLDDNSSADFESGFVTEARQRINNLIAWSSGDTNSYVESDYEKVKASLHKELETDWTSTEASWSQQYKDTHRFTATWQAYMYEHNAVQEQWKPTETGSTKYKDDEGFVYTTLDPWQPNAVGGRDGVVEDQGLIDAIEACGSEDAIREYCINTVFETYSARSSIQEVLSYWATATTILEDFTNEARADYFSNLDENERVESISGITYSTKSGSELSSSFKGAMGESFTNENYSVLKIVINGIDPKAIYNFSFPVAPLHYYAAGDYTDRNGVTKDYAKEAAEGRGFGVAVGDPNFIKEILQNSAKSGIPVGAGPYKTADMEGNPTSDRNKFKDSSIISFVRNDYFETVGTGISNAKIKKVQFKVLKDDDIMNALITKSIDFAMPNATTTNATEISNNSDFLASTEYSTGGYGYIGINPKFIPEVYVRQAIMKAMDTSQSVAYYGTKYAEVINRPMTTTTWAYPQGVSEYASIAYTTIDSEITELVEKAGYEKGSDGVYVKARSVAGIGNAPNGTRLKFPFTIAGDTTNHPAYNMLCNTRNRLNGLGFDITVKTSSTALTDLATGNLEVWAAAWSSSIDPDPYQIYHKDSNATSVLNWNYKNILNNPLDWEYEYEIIAGAGAIPGAAADKYEEQSLSDWIDKGRETIVQSERINIYHKCLDMIMDLAVELPTYQRKDLCVYNTKVIDAKTLVQSPSHYMGLFDKLWEIDYV